MKKSFLFLFVFVMLASQSLVLLHADEKPMYKAHFLTFTETVISHLETQLNLTREEAVARQLKTSLKGEAQLKKAISDRITGFNGQWIFFGPNHLNYTESDMNQTITDMYGAFHDSNQPIYQAMQNLKAQYNIQNMNPYIITREANFAQKSENIMIRNSQNVYGFADFLKMITPSSWNESIQPFIAPYPDGYPGSERNETYGTLGATLVHKVFENFEYKGDSLVHFTNDKGQPDSVIFSMGNRNVVDEFAWGNVFDTSGTALGVRTTPDTLTIKANEIRFHDLYPGWNDYGTDTILYTGGDSFGKYEDHREAQYLCAFKAKSEDVGETQILAYAPKITGIPDAFAMDYILVQFVPEIEYPTLQVPENIKVNDTFTVSLAGNPELMTSWEPEINISGIKYEFISTDKYTYTYKALSAGQANITLHHNSLLVLEDETHTIDVLTSVEDNNVDETEIQITPNPAGDYIEIRQPSEGLKPSEGYSVRIFNVLGVCLIATPPTPLHSVEGSKVRIDVSALAPGVYYVRVGGQVQKFVKK